MTSVSIFQIEKYWPWLYNISLLLLNGYLEIYQIILSLSVKTKIISEIPLAILFANYLKKRRSWELFKDFMAHWNRGSEVQGGKIEETLQNSEEGCVVPYHPGPMMNGSPNLAAAVQIQSSQRIWPPQFPSSQRSSTTTHFKKQSMAENSLEGRWSAVRIVGLELPGGPVAKTPSCQCRRPGFDPTWHNAGQRFQVLQLRPRAAK